MRTTAITIATEYGPGEVWWDDESNPANAGWVLRYHRAPEGADDALGRRHLDEALEPDRQTAIYRLTGEIEVQGTDEAASANVGTYDADGGWWQESVDDLLAIAGYRRVSDWSGDDDATCQVVSDHAAEREALRFLAREGIGAGRQLTSARAAQVAGLKDAASWRATAWRPEPDDHHDARTPWWWETTVLRAMASRPGQGARTDLR